ncbi:ATP-binding cassette domain-containing protein [Marinibaculum pumilum]|uniref:ATP-binding cassette domain-containing protein n=1 Tax=Marinibaculum pumilum TaxID=1766165 RepID=A0ABV7KUV1_9PROT
MSDRAPPAALEIDGAGHSFGRRRALDGLTCSIAPGSFTVLLGPNGAGKTTLFSLVSGLLPLREGRIAVSGFDIRRQRSQVLRRLGLVFQARSIEPDLTVAQVLRYGAALQGIGRRTAGERIATWLDRGGLADRAGDKVRTLSGGQQRRVEILRALLHDPALLLLDEASTGLDIDSRAALLAEVRGLCSAQGTAVPTAVLWATHLIDEIDPVTDHLLVLAEGRLRAAGTVAEVLAAAGTDDVATAYRRLTAPTAKAA